MKFFKNTLAFSMTLFLLIGVVSNSFAQKHDYERSTYMYCKKDGTSDTSTVAGTYTGDPVNIQDSVAALAQHIKNMAEKTGKKCKKANYACEANQRCVLVGLGFGSVGTYPSSTYNPGNGWTFDSANDMIVTCVCRDREGTAYDYDVIGEGGVVIDDNTGGGLITIDLDKIENPRFFPNPVKANLQVVYNPKKHGTNAQLNLFNLMGNNILSTSLGASGNENIDVSGLPNGTYIAIMINDTGVLYQEKIIIQH